MRVLYLCHRIPYPPNKGDKIRAFHQLQGFSSRHEVDLFTLADDPADVSYTGALSAYCDSVTVSRIHRKRSRLRTLPSLLTNVPLTVPFFCSADLHAAVREAIRKRSYDRIFVYCSAMAQYARWNDDIPVVTDLVDVDSDKWTQYSAHAHFPMAAVYRREGRRLRDYERRVCEMSSSVVVATDREAALAREICDTANIHVITNGVDTSYFMPGKLTPAHPPTVMFTGDMSYFPNEQAVTYFANAVLPLIQSGIQDVRFIVVGRNPSRKVRQLGTRPGVEVTGFVPDIRVYLTRARVAVAPFCIAAGIQNKVLEAMACGVPVVATSCVARGLSADVAQTLRTADTPTQFASAVMSLLQNPEEARAIGERGRRRVAASYNWERSQNLLLQLLDSPRMTAAITTSSIAAQ